MQIQKKTLGTVGLLCFGLLSFPVSASAQDLYHINFEGSCTTVDADGNEFSEKVTEKSLIRQYAPPGTTNFNNLVLVFHLNVDERGDAISIYNKKTGELVNGVFSLFFPQQVTNPSGKKVRRFAYVYTVQHGFSSGTALLNEQMAFRRDGSVKRFSAQADMQWYQLAVGTNNLRLCRGKFTTANRFKP